ncbi:MAG: histidine kinase [Sphingobacterium sp.]|jgi:hypothetical protein|nr:histidine kinase [Sphingobacterium sp.]
MDYFLLKFRSIFNRVKYLGLIVLAYIIGEYKMVTLNGGRGKWWVFGLFYLIDTFFFFFNCYFLYPRAYEKRKTIYQPILLILIGFALYYTLTICGYLISIHGFNDPFAHISRPVLVNYGWRVIIVSALAAIPFGFFTFIKMLKREKLLENNALYSRISPHLIFNSLNFIHAEIRGMSPKADKMITYMSEYARYGMAEPAEDGKANLHAELGQLDTLIKINTLRHGDVSINQQIKLNEPADAYRIPPHLILTLAENVFKYGVTNDPKKKVRFELFDDARMLHVSMSNWKADATGVISHQQGLDNLRKRLKNMYDDFFTMKVEESEDFFCIYIVIPL